MPGPKRWTSRLFVGWRRSHGGWAAALRAKPETLLHVSALLLAPIGVAQPLEIWAVTVGVVLAARAARARPSKPVAGGVAAAVAETVAFVVLATLGTAPTSTQVTAGGLAVALLIVAAVGSGLGLTVDRSPGPPALSGIPGHRAVDYGFGSALIGVIARAFVGDLTALLSPLTLLIGFTMVHAVGGAHGPLWMSEGCIRHGATGLRFRPGPGGHQRLQRRRLRLSRSCSARD